jgi:hypothetical protein
MSDFRSQVTRRPRSKLENVVDLVALESLPPPSAEYASLSLRCHSAVAPTHEGLRVALRLGYPGNEPASIARALDAEIPEGDITFVAWRAHRSLQVIAETVCTKDQPKCDACAVKSACDYHGVGIDPARRLGGSEPPAG